MLLTDGPGGRKWMDTGRPETRFHNLVGGFTEPVETNTFGWEELPVAGGSLSVWVGEAPERAAGELTLLCHDGHTRWGASIWAVGEIAELGQWDPERAVPLSPDAYPTWQGTVRTPAGRTFEWKCIKKGDFGVAWQPGGNNRYPGSGLSSSGSFSP